MAGEPLGVEGGVTLPLELSVEAVEPAAAVVVTALGTPLPIDGLQLFRQA